MRVSEDSFAFLDGLSLSELVAVGVKYEVDVDYGMIERIRPDLRERVEERWRLNRVRAAQREELESASNADAQPPPQPLNSPET